MSATNNVLIIVGMHRSGTTLTARWLQACGLHIGDNLLRSKFDHANPDGLHYEDMDFLNLHKSILHDSDVHPDGFVTDEHLTISSTRRTTAHQIIQDRQNTLPQWGWKEPRTCLFLDFWLKQLPDAKMLVIYRSFEQVADSLLRRKLNHENLLRRTFYRWQHRPIQNYSTLYIQSWIRYNRDILAVIKQHSEQALVLRTRDMLTYDSAILHYLTQIWGFELNQISADEVYTQNRLKNTTSYVDLNDSSLTNVIAEAQTVYDELDQWRTKSLEKLANLGSENGN